MEKIENFFIGLAIGIILSYLIVWIGNQGEGLFNSICGFVGMIIQFPTSKLDLLLMYFKTDCIICILGIISFIAKFITE